MGAIISKITSRSSFGSMRRKSTNSDENAFKDYKKLNYKTEDITQSPLFKYGEKFWFDEAVDRNKYFTARMQCFSFEDLFLFGYPESTPRAVKYSTFLQCFDMERQIPKWIMEHFHRNICEDTSRGDVPDKASLKDPLYNCLFLPRNTDYVDPEYKQTFLVSNTRFFGKGDEHKDEIYSITTCVPVCDLLKAYLEKFNSYVRTKIKDGYDIYVLTGPLFSPIITGPRKHIDRTIRYKIIGNNRVAVPTHIFKFLLYAGGRHYFCAKFLFPNRAFNYNLHPALFKLSRTTQLEQATGIDIFGVVEFKVGKETCTAAHENLGIADKTIWETNKYTIELEAEEEQGFHIGERKILKQ